MLDWLERSVQANPDAPLTHAIPIGVMATRFGVAFVMGCVVTAVHHFTAGARRPGDEERRSLAATLVLLSVLIALVMMVIGDSLARAFSLAGALAIIRFRTVVEDTRDTAFVMFAVIAGMAAGTGYLIAPVVCTPLVVLAAWAFRPRHRPAAAGESGGPRRGLLVLRLAAGRPPDERRQAGLGQHLRSYRMVGLSTARGGSALDATYAVDLPPADRVYTMVNELTRVDGVQGVELKED